MDTNEEAQRKEHKGFVIYYDNTKRTRPWSVRVPGVGRHAAKRTLDDCIRFIDQLDDAIRATLTNDPDLG